MYFPFILMPDFSMRYAIRQGCLWAITLKWNVILGIKQQLQAGAPFTAAQPKWRNTHNSLKHRSLDHLLQLGAWWGWWDQICKKAPRGHTPRDRSILKAAIQLQETAVLILVVVSMARCCYRNCFTSGLLHGLLLRFRDHTKKDRTHVTTLECLNLVLEKHWVGWKAQMHKHTATDCRRWVLKVC